MTPVASIFLSINTELEVGMLTRTSSAKTVGTFYLAKLIDGTLNPPIADGAVVLKEDRIVWVGERRACSGRIQAGHL